MYGYLKIDPPAPNNQVKISMYGTDFLSHQSTSASEPCYTSACNMGSKVIAVLGGQVDIQGLADPTCPAWEKLQEVGTGVPQVVRHDCGGTACPPMEILAPCSPTPYHTNQAGKLAIFCPVKHPGPIYTGDTKSLMFRAKQAVPWDPPKDPNTGQEMELRIRSPCFVNSQFVANTNRCVLQCGIDQTATVPGWDFEGRYVYTSQRDEFELPCDATGQNCMSLKITGPCVHSPGHSAAWGKYIAFCPLEQTTNIAYGANVGLTFTSKQSGQTVSATGGVAHWAWGGTWLFFSPDVDVSVVNAMFPAGTELGVSYMNAQSSGQSFNVGGVYHWSWVGLWHFFFPEDYSAAECSQAATDFNTMFPVGYDIDISRPAELQEFETTGQIGVSGVIHWAFPSQQQPGEHLLYFYPESTLEEFNAVFTPGTKLEPVYTDESEYTEIKVSPKFAQCWPAGTELLLTSHTRWSDDRQIVSVSASDPATGTLTLSSPIQKPISLADSADFAIEVASLTRRIVFDSDRDPGTQWGGHFWVHNTPTPQTISGVEIRNFGQQSLLGRYPLHFHFCGDSPGSIVSKNVV